MDISTCISSLMKKQDLSREQATDAMNVLMSGEATSAQIAGFLVALHMKGETIEEITGLAKTMREKATRIETSRTPLVDTCGTGGDHSGSFNVSTTSAFVVAGADVAVAKHGNRSATSKCGSADVLETMGVNIGATPEQVGKCIDEVGIGFLFARSLHGAMKHVGPTRGELKVRTVFNILGPLTNPAGADGQVMGVFDKSLVEPLAHVLQNLGSRHVFIVAGSDGLDEITLSGPTFVAEAANGTVNTYEVTPEDFGLSQATKDDIQGGDSDENAQLLKNVLSGKEGPHRDIVLLNAAPAIIAGCVAADWKEGIEAAKKSIDSGAAMEKLEELIKVSNDS